MAIREIEIIKKGRGVSMDYEIIIKFLKTSSIACAIGLLLLNRTGQELSWQDWAILILGSIMIIGLGGILIAMLTM